MYHISIKIVIKFTVYNALIGKAFYVQHRLLLFIQKKQRIQFQVRSL